MARKSWCESNTPNFTAKAADVFGLYVAAIVLCVDEKPSIPALERAQGYLKLPNGHALTGQSHDYKRHGTTTLFAALEVETGKIIATHSKRRRRVEFLEFMDSVAHGQAHQFQADPDHEPLPSRYENSEATIYNWKAKFGGMDVSEMKQLKALKDENAKLKKLLAEQMLDAAALCEPLKKIGWAAAKGAAIVHLQAIMSLWERWAYSIVGADRKMIPYLSTHSAEAARAAGCAISPTSGVVSATAGCSFCAAGGRALRVNRIYRLYREEGPTVRKRRPMPPTSPQRMMGYATPTSTAGRCSTRATWRTKARDSNRCWMKVCVPCATTTAGAANYDLNNGTFGHRFSALLTTSL